MRVRALNQINLCAIELDRERKTLEHARGVRRSHQLQVPIAAWNEDEALVLYIFIMRWVADLCEIQNFYLMDKPIYGTSN
jgi:hypothetical protein